MNLSIFNIDIAAHRIDKGHVQVELEHICMQVHLLFEICRAVALFQDWRVVSLSRFPDLEEEKCFFFDIVHWDFSNFMSPNYKPDSLEFFLFVVSPTIKLPLPGNLGAEIEQASFFEPN